MQAEEQVKLAYMAVKTQIISETVADSSYDATTAENTTKLGKIVEDELTVEGWNVDYSIAGKIYIIYNNSKIMADTIENGNPKKNGEADFALFLEKQEAILKTVVYLSKEYQQVEYIESTGTQYIDTGINANGGTYVKFTARFNSRTTANALNCCILGTVQNGWKWFALNFGQDDDAKNNIYVWSGKGHKHGENITKVTLDNSFITNMHTYEFGPSGLSIDGKIQVEKNSTNVNTTRTLKIFTYDLDNVIRPGIPMCIYKFTIKDNLNIVKDFIPCYRKSDNEIGLYDTVEGKFYTNQGTGDFISGPDV